MKFDHMVKYGDKYYATGEDVPIEEKETGKAEETPLPFSDSDIIFEEKEKQYTKTEINRMDKAELQTLAEEKGIDGAYDMTGSELKKLLIDMLVG